MNFILFGRQKLTTLKGRLLRPNFDTMIKENKPTFNGNKFYHFTEKVNNSALITVVNHSKSHQKCSCCGTPVFATVCFLFLVFFSFFFVWCVFCLKVLCAEEFEDTKVIIIEVENTTQLQIIGCTFLIFKLFLLYIKR